ncbi:MAG TPA: VWA domain-containing protein [Polyangiaceae bacterium]|nr:VWA domain-containing protein [Polyangiaceae bacterium]
MAASASVDAFSSMVGFARALRQAGIGVSSGQIQAFARAFEWLDPCSRTDIRHAARATLLCRREDAALFERVFDGFWLGVQPGQKAAAKMPLAPRHRRDERPALAMLLAERARASDPELSVQDRSLARSEDEILGRKDFALMTELELDAIRRLFERRRWQFATRVTRRKVARRSGRELDLRRLCARAARTGGVALELPRRAPKIKQRPIVILADISGSMELYTRVLLQFMHVLRRRLTNVESFVFATRLTRITAELALHDVDRALEEVSANVIDFASGTRIGESLHAFNTQWAGRLLARGAVVIIMSDGWEHGSAEQLKKEMRILRERCFRLIWLNPRLGRSDYLPRVEGMAAALGHVDDFLSCHDMQSLQAVATHLEALPRRRGTSSAASLLAELGAGGAA